LGMDACLAVQDALCYKVRKVNDSSVNRLQQVYTRM